MNCELHSQTTIYTSCSIFELLASIEYIACKQSCYKHFNLCCKKDVVSKTVFVVVKNEAESGHKICHLHIDQISPESPIICGLQKANIAQQHVT